MQEQPLPRLQNSRFSLHRPTNASLAAWVAFFTALYFYLPVMTLYLQQRGLNLFEISVMSGTILAAQFIAEVPTGVLADRWGRKRSWVIAIFLQLAGEAWFFFARSYWEFLMIAVVAGVGFAFASGTLEALVYDTLPPGDREHGMKIAMGRVASAGRLGNLAAFLISGLIASQLTQERYLIAIGLTVISVAVGAALTLLAREPEVPAQRRDHPTPWSILMSGLRALRHNPRLQRIALLMILSDPFGFYLVSLNQPYLQRAGVQGAWFGPVLAVGSLIAALSERYSYKLEGKLGMRSGMFLVTALPGALYLLMAPVRLPVLAVALFIIQYGILNAARPLLRSYINNHIESENRATVLSMIALLGNIYLAVMGAALGAVADRSLTGLFLFMGVMVLAASLLFRIDERHRATGVPGAR